MSESSAPPPSLPPQVVRKNRIMLLVLVAMPLMFFLLGDLAYRFGWFEGGQTNKGQLINPPISFADFQAQDAAGNRLDAAFAKQNWWLLYVLPADCETACRNRLFQMRQVRKALGKEADRVRQVLVVTEPVDARTQALIAHEFADFAQVQASVNAVDAALRRATPSATSDGLLYVMDPMGWIMLAYAAEADEKASVTKAEDILKDLQKLLKASRIG